MVHNFLFWQPTFIQTTRPLPTTLENLNKVCGFSGTDTSMLEIAGHLAQTGGHTVRVLSGGPASKSDGISYLSPNQDHLDVIVDDLATVDVLVLVYLTPESMGEMMDLARRTCHAQLSVVMWCHSINIPAHQIEFLQNLCEARGARFSIVGVSDFVRGHLNNTLAKGPTCSYTTIPNALNPGIFTRTPSTSIERKKDPPREPLSMVFMASYERGGRVAREVHASLDRRGLNMGAFRAFSYCDANRGITSLPKSELAARLRQCDYFVYPLVLDYASVHHDTYACVVLEAMAAGVLVVSWNVACLKGVYGDLITLVEPPVFPGYDPTASGGSNPLMLGEAAVEALADAVHNLIDLPTDVREARRENARAWALTQTWKSRAEALLVVVDSTHQ